MTSSCAVLRLVVPLLRFIFADIPQKVIALFIAVFLWFTAALDRSYVTSFSVPVTMGEVTTSKIITGFETRAATVTVEGKGRDLVGLRLRNPSFRLNIPELRAGAHRFGLDPASLNLPKTLTLRAIAPESVELRLSEVDKRTVTVQIPIKGQPAKGLTVTASSAATEAILVGPQEDISMFAAVVTESVDLARFRQSETLLLRVVPPSEDGFTVEPESVKVFVAVDREAARIFPSIPVRAVAPTSRSVTVTPKEAQIAVAGPAGRLDDLKPEDIVARIKVANLEPGQRRLPAEIVLPSGFHLVRCVPGLFEVTVR